MAISFSAICDDAQSHMPPHKGSVKSTLGLFEQGKPYASLTSQYPCGLRGIHTHKSINPSPLNFGLIDPKNCLNQLWSYHAHTIQL